jgi:hypothetical protein
MHAQLDALANDKHQDRIEAVRHKVVAICHCVKCEKIQQTFWVVKIALISNRGNSNWLSPIRGYSRNWSG